MKIAVNTRLLLKNKLEGIGWVAYETLRRMVKDHPEVEFYFLFDRERCSLRRGTPSSSSGSSSSR